MSEVLITLAIIGVVASLTIGVFYKNIQRFILKNQFLKMYNTLNQAHLKVINDLGYSPECFYILGDGYSSECSLYFKNLTDNLKIIKRCEKQAVTKGCINRIEAIPNYGGPFGNAWIINFNSDVRILNDGSQLFILSSPYFMVDTNGTKGPNKWGYDLYTLITRKKDNNSPIKIGCYLNYTDDGGVKCDDIVKFSKF